MPRTEEKRRTLADVQPMDDGETNMQRRDRELRQMGTGEEPAEQGMSASEHEQMIRERDRKLNEDLTRSRGD